MWLLFIWNPSEPGTETVPWLFIWFLYDDAFSSWGVWCKKLVATSLLWFVSRSTFPLYNSSAPIWVLLLKTWTWLCLFLACTEIVPAGPWALAMLASCDWSWFSWSSLGPGSPWTPWLCSYEPWPAKPLTVEEWAPDALPPLGPDSALVP